MTGDQLLTHMQAVSVEDLLLPLMIQLAIIIVLARIFAALFRWMGQPAVVGEIAAGIVLGPSLFGALFPEAFAAIFRPELHGLSPLASDQLLSRVLMAIAQIGLVFLLFLIGLEFDFGHLKLNGPAAVSISLTGILFPFALGIVLGWGIHPIVAKGVPGVGFVLFMGVAMSITAIPILGRMMVEMGISKTPLAALTISAAAVDDAAGWILLATVAALTRAELHIWQTAGMIAATIGFAAFMIVVARPLLSRLVRFMLRVGNGELGVNSLAVILAILFVCAIITNMIGIFAIFGAFLFGAVLSGEVEFREAINRKMRDLVTAFFLPVFFAYTGLRTNIGTLETSQLWLIAGLVCLVAIVGKFGGCTLAAWLSGLKPREAACVGIMMNTRALMELIAINVGKDLGVIPDSVFCMLVLMALLTTFMTTPILLWSLRSTELEPLVRSAGFLRRLPEPTKANVP
jgi:Kef-type K+ transport system membrane component KefB